MFKPSPGGFTGRVIESEFAYTGKPKEFLGPHLFLQASTPEQVQAVVNAAEDFEIRLRSGNQVSRTDKELPDIAGGIVLDLSAFREITWDDNQVTVGVGVTARALANSLAEKNRVLPLGENPDKSIISDVLSEQPSVMVRTLGQLNEYVTHVALITAGDESNNQASLVGVEDFPDWMQVVRDNRAAATSLTFRTVSADSLWSLEATFFRPDNDGYLKLAKQLLSDSRELPNLDMSLRSYYMPVDQIAIGTIAMAGSGDDARADAMKKIVERTAMFYEGLPEEEREIAMQVHERLGAQVYPAILDSGQKPSSDPVLITNRIFEKFTTGPAAADFLTVNESKILDKAMGYQDPRLDTRIVVLPGDEALIAGFSYVFDSSDIEPEYGVSEALLDKDLVATTDASVVSALAQLYHLFPPTVGHPELPGFMGQVYGEGLDLGGYEEEIAQYCNEYSDEPAQRPYLLCKASPTSEARNGETDEIDEISDISLVLDLVKRSREDGGDPLDLVIRSGGHQYSGLSSGGNNTVVILMDNFTDISQRADSEQPGKHLLTVGAGVLVTKLYKSLSCRGLVLPGGQCPKVKLGGHVQTGGYGFFTRSAGLLLDYVHSFKIVLANKSVKTVTRPSAATAGDPINDELFRAVLGGSPGSFGVLISYTFSLSPDSAQTTSTRYKGTRIYTSKKARKMMDHMRAWSDGVGAEMSGLGTPIPPGRDFIITFSSAAQRLKLPLIRTHINVLETGENNRPSEDKLQDPANTNNSMKLKWPFSAYQCLPGSEIYCFGATERNGQNMSLLIDEAISRSPATSKDGRELDLPYQKRLHCSSNPLSEKFVEKFCDQMDEIVRGGFWSDINLIAQVGVLGGKHADPDAAALSAIEHRDAVVGFTFDIFHSPNQKARVRAKELQEKIAGWVGEHFNDKQERRILWGTFDSTSLADETVRKAYYPNDERFERLVKVKQKVDSEDIFRNEFTIPPTLVG